MKNNELNKRLPKTVEIEGNTIEGAIKKAQELFGVPRENLIIKVVSEEKRGLFGMEGAKPAKIKATLKNKKKT